MYVKWRIPEDTFFDEEDGNTRYARDGVRVRVGQAPRSLCLKNWE